MTCETRSGYFIFPGSDRALPVSYREEKLSPPIFLIFKDVLPMNISIKIYKTMLAISGAGEDSRHLFSCETIEWHGEFWLVPRWIKDSATGKFQPLRIICLTPLPHQKAQHGEDFDFVVNNPIPKAVLESGTIPEQTDTEFRILESPEIFVDIPIEPVFH
jgi:hypothetical protein